MVSLSNILCADGRVAALRGFPRGLQLLLDCLGSSREPPDNLKGVVDSLSRIVREERYSDPDLFFRLLKHGFQQGSRGLQTDFTDFTDILRSSTEFVFDAAQARSTTETLTIFEGWIDILSKETDEALIRLIDEKILIDGRSFFSFIDEPTYLYTKVNHGYWEHLVNLRFKRTGRQYYRHFSPVVETGNYEVSGFNHLFFAVAREHIAQLPPSPGFRDMHFGISVDAGERHPKYCSPLPAAIRGAMIGALSFLEAMSRAVTRGTSVTLAAGYTPKSMVLDNSINAFVEAVAAKSELVMFIVPTHLRHIKLKRDIGAARAVFVVPASYIHELWLPVLALAAAALEEAFSRFRAVTIFTQAGVVSYPLMVLAKIIQTTHTPNCEVRYFDMGQALDIATLGTKIKASPWLRKRTSALVDLRNPFAIASR